MANTLTNLIPDAYAALNVVSRELVGLIPAVTRDSKADSLAIGQTLRSAVAPVNTAGKNITPAMALPAAADQAIGNVPFTLTKARAFPFSWSGEEQKAVNTGPGFLSIQQQQIAQAIRAAVAEISIDGYAAARVAASRAYGTAGTNPFATNLDASSFTRQILDDNGAPSSDRHLIINTTAGAALRNRIGGVLNANTAITPDVLTQGVLIDINGFRIREDAQFKAVTAGTGASATVNASAYAVGATVLTLASAGTGTILAGDIITIGADTNKYVVVSGDADVSNGGTITIAAPGLRQAIVVSTSPAITVGAAFTANLGFSRDAILLGTRLPALTDPNDMAIMRETITDPLSGLSFELAAYPGYRMTTFEIGIAWGWAVENPEHLAIMLG
jgi:hypothetical protein